jgi:hypothetical protein
MEMLRFQRRDLLEIVSRKSQILQNDILSRNILVFRVFFFPFLNFSIQLFICDRPFSRKKFPVASSLSEYRLSIIFSYHFYGTGETPLSEAVYRNDVAATRTLLQHGAKASASNQLLHHCIRRKQFQLFDALLDSRVCGVDSRDRPNGDTPLMVACASGQAGVVAALLKRGEHFSS